MKTEIWKMNPGEDQSEAAERAGMILKSGGLVVFPTETVYGLGGNALDPEASKKIYAAKGRPSDNPLIVHIADMDALPAIAAEIPEAAVRLADAFWPGPLTMIFRKTALVPPETSGGLDTVAVRMPIHPAAAAVIRAAGGYVAAPSANVSGRPSATNVRDVIEDFDGRIEMILDGGNSDIGIESTIVDMTEAIPVILRPGFINEEMLRKVLGEVRIDPGILDENAARGIRPKAPGMRYRHYAPKAALTIVEGDGEKVTEKINELTEAARKAGKRAGVIASAETEGRYEADVVRGLGSRSSEVSISRHLFAVLREFDRDGVDVIYSESFDTPKLGMAIMNRLLKAAGHQVLQV